MKTDRVGANTSCFSDTRLEDAVDRIRQMGFRSIGLLAYDNARYRNGDLAGFWFRSMNEIERERLKSLIQGFEQVSLHAPFVDLPLFSYDPRVSELSRERVMEALEAAGYLGARVVVVHANARPNVPVQEYWNDVVETFRALGDFAAEQGVRIGVETGFPDNLDQFADLFEAIGHHAVGATIDTGHLVRYVEADLRGTAQGIDQLNLALVQMARQLGPLVIHCHIHDVRLSDWKDHQPVGDGVLDFQGFLSVLQSLDYQGMLELELEVERAGQEDALVSSKARLERLLSRVSMSRRAA